MVEFKREKTPSYSHIGGLLIFFFFLIHKYGSLYRFIFKIIFIDPSLILLTFFFFFFFFPVALFSGIYSRPIKC